MLRSLSALPPSVSILEWSLAFTQLAVAGISFLVSEYDTLALIITALTVLAVGQFIASLKHILNSRSFGLPILSAASIFFFWVEAQSLAVSSPRFAIVGPPIPTGAYSPELIHAGIFYVAFFQVGMLIGYSVRLRLRFLVRWVSRRIDSRSHVASISSFLLAACAIVPFLATYGFNFQAAIDALLELRKSGAPNWQDLGLLQYTRMFGIYAAAYFLARVCVRRQYKKIWILATTIITIIPFVFTGTRYLAVFVFLPTIILLIRQRAPGKLRASHLTAWGSAAGMVFVLLQLQMQLRHRGVYAIENVGISDVANVNVTYQFSSLLFARYLVPGFYGYFHEVPEPYFVMYWVPRSLWSDKPFMESWETYNAAYVRGQHFNVTPSIIGQFYLNWGIAGVFYSGLMLGVFAYVADLLIMSLDSSRQLASSVMIGMFYAFIVTIFRFYAPMYFGYFAFGIVGTVLLTKKVSGQNGQFVRVLLSLGPRRK